MLSEKINEEQLGDCLERIYNGDETAFKELYDISAFHIYRFALSIVKYSYLAEEVTQETFLNIMVHCQTHPIRKPKSWLFTVVKNCCLKALKEEHLSQKEDLDLYKEQLISCDNTETTDTPLREIPAVQSLDEQEFQLVLLCKLEGLTIPQAAKILKMNRIRARSKYDYAIKKIKRYYRERGD